MGDPARLLQGQHVAGRDGKSRKGHGLTAAGAIYSTSERRIEMIEELSRSLSPVRNSASRSWRMSPTTSLGADELMEGPGDAHDLVELEYSAPDHHHEQIARDARRARLRRIRYEGEAARGVAICESRQAHTSAVGPDRKDLRALAIGEEDGAPGARGQSLGQRALEDTPALTARPHPPELAGSGLPRRLRVPVARDPQLIRLVHGKDARTRHAHIVWIEHLPARVQAEHDATLPVGHVHGARSVDDAALRLHEKESHSFLGRAAREELGAAVAHAIEGADPPIAIERGDE